MEDCLTTKVSISNVNKITNNTDVSYCVDKGTNYIQIAHTGQSCTNHP